MSFSQTIDSLHLIGKSDAMQQLYKMIGRVCNVDCAILLVGETGSGRSVVARALHYFGHRASSPFNLIQSGNFPESQDEALLGIDQSHQNEATCYVTEFASLTPFVHHQLLEIHEKRR